MILRKRKGLNCQVIEIEDSDKRVIVLTDIEVLRLAKRVKRFINSEPNTAELELI